MSMAAQEAAVRILAVDLGGTRLRVALADADGQLTTKHAVDTPAAGGPAGVVAAIVRAARHVAANAEGGAVTAAGVAAPGPLFPASGVVYATPNLPGWRDFPLADALRSELGLPVYVANDANLAGLAEARRGAGRSKDPLLYLTISTGVGGAVVVAGRVLEGASGLAGELGHVIVKADGPRCNFGHPGCLEAMASGTAISRRAEEAVAAGRRTSLAGLAGGGEPMGARQVAVAAREGDEVAREILESAGRYLGLALGGLVNVFDPQRIVLGGGVMGSWDLLEGPVRRGMAQVVMTPDKRVVDVVPAQFGDDAGLVGAAIYALEKIGR